MASDALLLGRVTCEIFAESWPQRIGEFTNRMNSLPKYVVSTSLQTAVADILPNAERRTLHGQSHNVAPEAMAPVLIEFFKD